MTQFFVLIMGLSISYPLWAIDLNLGFKTQYPLTEMEKDQIAEMNGYEKAPRVVSEDGQWLKCEKEQEGCRDIPFYQGKYQAGEFKPGDQAEPWLGYDVASPEQAKTLSLIMQKYVYEGWIQDVAEADKENSAVHFKKNKKRTWCAVPWMNYIDGIDDAERKGRDPVHGLTKEFPIDNSQAYQDIPFKPEVASVDRSTGEIEYREGTIDPDSFSSYGVAYFNRPNCEFFETIFGTEDSPKDPTQWIEKRKQARGSDVQKTYETKDGSVSFKMLFTTLQAEPTENDSHAIYPVLADAYKWVAHVSTHRRDTPRIVQKVSHIQMDIAIKDSRLANLMGAQGATNPDDVIPWIMLNYYFDPNYTNPIFDTNSDVRMSDEEIAKAPQGLKHMRPIGIQFGLDKGHSIIFHEPDLGLAANNHTLPAVEDDSASRPIPGQAFMDTRLNGPADNPLSSCLGCHASAGVRKFTYSEDIRMSEFRADPEPGSIHPVFGVLDNKTYLEEVKPNVNVDFNQQIRIGLQRYLKLLKDSK